MFPIIVDFLSTLSNYKACWLGVFWHNCYMFGIDSTQIGVFKKVSQIGLTCLLQSNNTCTVGARSILMS